MYIPKNKIITNLYTNGGEFIRTDNLIQYKGSYWKNHKGIYFTGKVPQDGPNIILEKISFSDRENTGDPNEKFNKNELALTDGGYDNERLNSSLIIEYSTLIPQNNTSFKLPNIQYPKPTEHDYKIGTFTRYFLVKANENIYLEVKKEIYSKILNKDKEWLWYLYIPFTLDWLISGNKEEVQKINNLTVLLTEKKINRKGLQQFLKGDYLKFFK